VDAHTEGPQERLHDPAPGHACRRLAGRCTLEDVANIGLLVLLDADQVGVSWAWQVDLVDLPGDRPGAHALLPVGVVAVGDLERDRAAQRAAVADAAGHRRAVALDLHAPPAPVTELTAAHVAVDLLGRELEPGGKPLDHACETGAVRLAGGYQTYCHG
jgi:hypothetical protein